MCSVQAFPRVATTLFSRQPVSRVPRLITSGRRHIAITPMASSKADIENAVKNNKVVVYSKTSCPYCSEVKSLFKSLSVDHIVFELDRIGMNLLLQRQPGGFSLTPLADAADGSQIQSTLLSITGRRTVPQVFVGGNFVGGCDDTIAAYNSGKLKTLFSEAGVSASM